MIQNQTIKSRLASGKALHGIWRIIQSEQLTEIIGLCGYDFQIFDCEHGGYDFTSLETAVRTCELAGSSPLIRVTGLNNTEVQKCLDLGAHGIVFPQLKGLADFKRAVQCMKYPPRGCRGFNPFTRAGAYNANSSVAPAGLSDQFAICMPIIETLAAVDELENIVRLEGIDMLYVGAYDLSVQLGCKGEMANPKLSRAIEKIIQVCRDAKMPAAAMVSSREQIESFEKLGISALVHTVDTNVVRTAFSEKLKLIS